MFLKIVCAVLFLDWGGQLGPLSVRVSSYSEYDHNEDLSSDFYDKYDAEEVLQRFTMQRFTKKPSKGNFRMNEPDTVFEGRRTLSPMELQEVKGALKQIFKDKKIDNLFQTQPTQSRSKRYDRSENENTDTQTLDKNLQRSSTPTIANIFTSLDTTEASETNDAQITKPTRSQIRRTKADIDDDYYDYFEKLRATIKPSSRSPANARRDMTTDLNPADANEDYTNADFSTVQDSTTDAPKTTTKTFPRLDIPALLDIIANLTYEYETNLTQWVNASLQRYSIPTCPTPTISTTTVTTTPTPTTPFNYDYEGNGTGIVMGKCYVCGLEVEAIPHKPYCADAFAGDFIPLVPVDPTARAQIGTYRKYCRYMDVNHYHINQSDPRSVWGRWTGGCSVRWIDLSGVYTQRSCRNRHKAILGRHYASKRLAKLEMGLMHVDNGCIISPAASLVPLSRGISLYARFHACVCTGNWCNVTTSAQWSVYSFVWPVIVVLRTVVLGTG